MDLMGVFIEMRLFTVMVVSRLMVEDWREHTVTVQMLSSPRVVVGNFSSRTSFNEILLTEVQGSITARTWCFFCPIFIRTTAVGNRLVVFGEVNEAIDTEWQEDSGEGDAALPCMFRLFPVFGLRDWFPSFKLVMCRSE